MSADERIEAVRAALVERGAWARLVGAVIDDRDAQVAEEQEQPGAEAWRERTAPALEAAKRALRDLGVDVDALLEAP